MAGLTATPVDAGGAITTSSFLTLSGTVFTQGDPCSPPGGDSVNLSGNVHVVTIVPPTAIVPPTPVVPPSPIRLHFNMADVTGTGSSTGNTYILTGASTFVPPTPIVPPTPVFQQVMFNLESTVGCAAQPIAVNFNLMMDATGHLVPDGSTASFPSF
jgi:hypothetical protein